MVVRVEETMMTKRERVMAALRGEPVDQVPVSLWLHNFATENSAPGLTAETLRLARTFDWDFLKPQCRAQCFAEMWGLTYRPSGERATPYTVTRVPFATAGDLAQLRPADPRSGALGEQLEALRAIRAAVGDVPIVWTVFAPIMVLAYLLEGGRDRALALARSEPTLVEHALEVISESLAGYAWACLEAGADGLFYATNVATRDLLTGEECLRLHQRYDRRVLTAVEDAPFNVLHLCGAPIHLDEFVGYPVSAFSVALLPGNPSLREVHGRTGRAVVGGLPAKPAIAGLTTEDLADRARAAVREMHGRWLLVGPDCSVNPDTPDNLLHAAGRAVRPDH
jgi:uroporphyrinogen decarboxylase